MEMPRAWAASSMVSPAKWRSLTRSALTGSLAASRSRASSSASSSAPSSGAAVLAAALAARVLHEDAAHGLGRAEVSPAVPVLGLVHVHQAEVRLVDQRGGLQRLPGLLPRQFRRRQAAQLFVDQRQQL